MIFFRNMFEYTFQSVFKMINLKRYYLSEHASTTCMVKNLY